MVNLKSFIKASSESLCKKRIHKYHFKTQYLGAVEKIKRQTKLRILIRITLRTSQEFSFK